MGNRPAHSASGRSWPRDVRDLFHTSSRSRRNAGSTDRPNRHRATDADDRCADTAPDAGRGGSTQRGGNGRTNYNKLNSCPDLQVVARSGYADHQQRQRNTVDEQPLKLNVKVYRSYSDLKTDHGGSRDALTNSSRMSSCADVQPVLEVRVYRRSTETLAMLDDRRRAQSLPRGMELNRSVGSDLQTTATSMTDSRRGSITGHSSRTASRKASARSSVVSIGPFKAVTAEEFPDTVTVRRKVADFERNFVTVFCDAFQCLAPLNQLAAVSVATRPDRANQAVSLLQYLESDAIPVDLLASKDGSIRPEDREYFLTIDPQRYPAVQSLKIEGSTAVERRLSVARELANDMAHLAAAELARMFEYQLSLINEPVAVRMLARHAVDCILQATRRRSRTLDHGALVRGVLRGRPPPSAAAAVVSVFIGNRELKWNLHDVFKKPALRRELTLPTGTNCHGAGAGPSTLLPVSPARSSGRVSSQSSAGGAGSETSDDGASWPLSSPAPWTFFTSPRCEPMRYGYRGQIIEKDYVNDCYRLNSEDEASFPEEVTVRYDDIHRVYSPLRRLASVDTLRSYCACAEARVSGSSARSPAPSYQLSALFTDFVRRRVTAESYMRDDCDVVFRALGVVLPADFLSRAPSRPGDLAALLASLADRKRPAAGAGVTRAAIELTRGCDEMSGRLLRTSEFDSSTGVVNGDAGRSGNSSRSTKALSLPSTWSTDKTMTEV